MKKYLFSAMLAAALALASCSDNEHNTAYNDAEKQGRSDAEALCHAGYTADKELHAALLAVKSREFEMRQNGDSVAANIYINAFKNYIKESNQTLAEKVL